MSILSGSKLMTSFLNSWSVTSERTGTWGNFIRRSTRFTMLVGRPTGRWVHCLKRQLLSIDAVRRELTRGENGTADYLVKAFMWQGETKSKCRLLKSFLKQTIKVCQLAGNVTENLWKKGWRHMVWRWFNIIFTKKVNFFFNSLQNINE